MNYRQRANSTDTQNKHYHDTLKLLTIYRNAIWSIEQSIEAANIDFKNDFGLTIKEFLDSVYDAGADLSGTKLESHSRTIKRSQQMVDIINDAVDKLRYRHKFGSDYYWILYYTYLSPRPLENTEAIIDKIQPHVKSLSRSDYFRKKNDAVMALGYILWGYTSNGYAELLSSLTPQVNVGESSDIKKSD